MIRVTEDVDYVIHRVGKGRQQNPAVVKTRDIGAPGPNRGLYCDSRVGRRGDGAMRASLRSRALGNGAARRGDGWYSRVARHDPRRREVRGWHSPGFVMRAGKWSTAGLTAIDGGSALLYE